MLRAALKTVSDIVGIRKGSLLLYRFQSSGKRK
jgi:hypothetical protein